jgi:hypothetical protein
MMNYDHIIGISILFLLCSLYVYERIRFLVKMNSYWKRQDHAKNLSDVKQLWKTTKGKTIILLFLLSMFSLGQLLWIYKS